MASDKCIQVCSVVNMAMILAVIIYVSVTKKSLASSSSKTLPAITLAPTLSPTIAPTPSPSLSVALLQHSLFRDEEQVQNFGHQYYFMNGPHLRGAVVKLLDR